MKNDKTSRQLRVNSNMRKFTMQKRIYETAPPSGPQPRGPFFFLITGFKSRLYIIAGFETAAIEKENLFFYDSNRGSRDLKQPRSIIFFQITAFKSQLGFYRDLTKTTYIAAAASDLSR